MACRLESHSSPSTPDELDEYCSCYMNGNQGLESPVDDDPSDVYSVLEKKENDLLLAAELGKALLERNEDLSKQNEELVEEYTQKIEELIQERYQIKLQILAMEGEYENTIKDLQTDIQILRQQLEDTTKHSLHGDKEKVALVNEMTHQNERLTEQLRKAAHVEEQLQHQVHHLKDQINTKRTSMQDRVNHLETLREEIVVLTDRKDEADRRIGNLTGERDSLALGLEESQDRIAMMERQNWEQDQQIRHNEKEVRQLREENNELQSRIEDLSCQVHSGVCDRNSSLFDEMGMSFIDQERDIDSKQVHIMRPSTLNIPGKLFDEDDIECDDCDLMEDGMLSLDRDDQAYTTQQTPDSLYSRCSGTSELKTTRREMGEAHRQLQSMCQAVRGHFGNQGHSSQISLNATMDAGTDGSLLQLLTDFEGLIQDLITKSQNSSLGTVFSPDSVDGDTCTHFDHLQSQIVSLNDELFSTKRELCMIKAEMSRKDEDLQQNTGELAELTCKVKMSSQHEEISRLQGERDRLQDAINGTLSRDEVVKQARNERDEAIYKRSTMEIELAKSHLEHMSLSSQLMEAIQQKVELSQQLELWQIDMHELIDTNVQHRLVEDEVKETDTPNSNSKSSSAESSPKSRRFSFWK